MVQVLPAVKKPLNFGAAFGQGLGEALPGVVNKEVERMRLQKGLQEISQAEGLTPFERYAKLSSIPGITPQMIQSGTNLLMQQDRAKAFSEMAAKEAQPKPNPFSQQIMGQGQEDSQTPSITKSEDLERIQEGFISPTKEEEYIEAGKMFNENPNRFLNDPQKAIDFVEEKTARSQKIAEDAQRRHENLTKVQDNVVSRLKNQADKLGVLIPPDIYGNIEDKAINSLKPKKEGGKGLTESQAKNIYGKELDAISRDYAAVNSIGDWTMIAKSPSATKNTLTSISDKFSKRSDSENLADTLISNNGLSVSKAYSIAYPISNDKELNNKINKFSDLSKKVLTGAITPQEVERQTLMVSEMLGDFLKKNHDISPLSIAYAIQKKGYDPEVWRKYVINNKEKFQLTPIQDRQLDKVDSFIPSLNDFWLNAFGGE